MNTDLVCLILGGILVLTGVIGGGFEVQQLKIPPVRWPTRIVALVAGFVLILMGFGDSGAKGAPGGVRPPDGVEAGSSPNPRTDDWLRDSLKAAVLKASDAEIQAYAENDVHYLDGVVVGEAYKKMARDIESAAAQDLYQVQQLLDQKFESFSVDPTGRHATVRMTETWTETWYSSKTRKCLQAFAPHPVPQSVSLERQGDQWVQSDLTTFGPSPTRTACP